MKHMYAYLILSGMLLIATGVGASGIPIHGSGEATTQAVDGGRNGVIDDTIKLQDKLVDSMANAVGGRETFGLQSLSANMKNALMHMSEVTTGAQMSGLNQILGPTAPGGAIAVQSGPNTVTAVQKRIEDTLTFPGRTVDQLAMTTNEKIERAHRRAAVMEKSAIDALAKAWIIQTENADTSESIQNTDQELTNASSQLGVIGTVLRLQEEIQKNLNTRLSILSEDLTMTGLGALEGNQ